MSTKLGLGLGNKATPWGKATRLESTLYHYSAAGEHNMAGSGGSKAVDYFRSSVITIPQEILCEKACSPCSVSVGCNEGNILKQSKYPQLQQSVV